MRDAALETSGYAHALRRAPPCPCLRDHPPSRGRVGSPLEEYCMHRVFRLLAALALALPLAGYTHLTQAQESRDMRRPHPARVIIDTDFNTIGDDGQVLAMAAQLDAAGAIDLMGVTVASGNQWLNQGVSDALK